MLINELIDFALRCKEAEEREEDRPTWTGPTLENAQLAGADLRYANLRGVSLQGADLRGADLRRSNLRGVDLRWANLSFSNLRRANLRGAILNFSNLRGANLEDAILRGASVAGARLDGVTLRGATLDGLDIQGANGIVSFGPVVNVDRMIYVVANIYAVANAGLPPNFQAGCFWGSADELKKAIAEKYTLDDPDLLKYRAVYLQAVDLMLATLEVDYPTKEQS